MDAKERQIAVELLRLKGRHRAIAAAAALEWDTGAVQTALSQGEYIVSKLDAVYIPEIEGLFKRLNIALPAGEVAALGK